MCVICVKLRMECLFDFFVGFFIHTFGRNWFSRIVGVVVVVVDET